MTVSINQQEIEMFEGALVKHALLRYFVQNKFDKSNIKEVVVLDKYGHVVDHDAPLSENQQLSIEEA
ncbi:MAG: hypothetical protein IKT00_04125 [Prevotella sp.]|nr:hypothetical protein [Prevotella sp.]